MKLNDLQDVYIHELKDLYSVEKMLIEALPKMIEKATNPKLVSALEDHLQETKRQQDRIEKIMENYNYSPGGHACKGMKGILDEANELLQSTQSSQARDVAIISLCGKVEHYEMAGYGTARAFAEQLGKHDEADLLLKSLDEESAADNRLETLAWRWINPSAREVFAT